MGNEIQRAERESDYVRVEDVASGGLRQVFIGLRPRGEAYPHETVRVEGADVDLDADGNIIGVTLFWRQA